MDYEKGGTMIHCHTLSIGYNTPIMSSLSLDIPDQSITGIVGANGIGKTTFFRALLGLCTIFSGTCTINDTPLLEWKTQHPSGIGHVNSDLHLPFRFRVRDLVACSRRAHHRPFQRLSDADTTAIDAALTHTQLTTLADRYYDELSSGQQQRAQLARVIAQQPQILLLDEPFSHLDPIQKQHMSTRLQAQPLTTLIISHDLQTLATICDQIVVMQPDRAQIISPGDVHLDNEIVTSAFQTETLPPSQ